MKILVTGGAGYTGIPLVEALINSGHEVTVFDNFMFGVVPILHLFGKRGVELVRGDVRDIVALSDAARMKDVIYHLAGISGYPACESDPAAADSVNVTGCENLANSVHPSQLVVYASTTSFYGVSSNECDEETPITPVNLYGATKKRGEEILMQSGRTISLRWPTVFGVSPRMRDDLMVNDFVRHAIAFGSITVYDGFSGRTFIHINDQTHGYLFALANSDVMMGKIFNVGSSRMNYSKQEIADWVSSKTDCSVVQAKVGDKDVRNFYVNYNRIRELGYKTKISLASGIDELLRYYNLVGV